MLYITPAAASLTNINTSPQEQISQGVERAQLAANILWRGYNLSRLIIGLLVDRAGPVQHGALLDPTRN